VFEVSNAPKSRATSLGFLLGKYPPECRSMYRDALYSINVFDVDGYLRNTGMQAVALSAAIAAAAAIAVYTTTYLPLFAAAAAVASYVIMTYLLTMALPAIKIKFRRSEVKEYLDAEMYNLLLILHGLACAGLTPLEAMHHASKSRLNEYVRMEFSKIFTLSTKAGKTLKQALLHIANITPSQEFADLCRSLSGVLEASDDFKHLTENRLLLMLASAKIKVTEYIESLRVVSEIYTLLSFMLVLGAVLLVLFGQGEGGAMATLMVLFGLPLLSAILATKVNVGAPDKYFERKLVKTAYIGITAIAAMVYAAAFIVLVGIKLAAIPLIGLTLLVSVAFKTMMGRQINRERGINAEMIRFLEKLVSLMDRMSLFEAIDNLNPFDFEYLREYIINLQVRSKKGVPLDEAFAKATEEADTLMMNMVSTTLSKAAITAERIPEVAHALMNQYANYRNYLNERLKTAGTNVMFLTVATLMVFGVIVMLDKTFLGLVTSIVPNTSSHASVPVSVPLMMIPPSAVSTAKKVIDLALIITPLASAYAASMMMGDTRQFFKYYVMYAAVAEACLLIVTGIVHTPSFLHGSPFSI